jgi:gamma-glutamylcyclotransferase (GGCT)/AIG2-like uncharacterized protein YtfP
MSEMKFFVYGSLSEGLVHFSKIKDFITHLEPARIQGTAYRLKVGFPVVVDSGNDSIPGQLAHFSSSTDLLISLLDEFHGFNRMDETKSLYIRKEVDVRTDQGIVKAWSYLLSPSKLPKTSNKIEGGDWVASLQQEPVLTDKLTERQRAYILRLGSSQGREIVPIDLSLYRELMNLEMIVDKGRRLALSKLGQEVFRYL